MQRSQFFLSLAVLKKIEKKVFCFFLFCKAFCRLFPRIICFPASPLLLQLLLWAKALNRSEDEKAIDNSSPPKHTHTLSQAQSWIANFAWHIKIIFGGVKILNRYLLPGQSESPCKQYLYMHNRVCVWVWPNKVRHVPLGPVLPVMSVQVNTP